MDWLTWSIAYDSRATSIAEVLLSPLEPLILVLTQRQPDATPADLNTVIKGQLVFQQLGGSKPLVHDPDLFGRGKGEFTR